MDFRKHIQPLMVLIQFSPGSINSQAVFIEQGLDAVDQAQMGLCIETLPFWAANWLQLWKFGFPKTEDIRLKANTLGSVTDFVGPFARVGHNASPPWMVQKYTLQVHLRRWKTHGQAVGQGLS
jgi:hypothetical protein